MVEANAMGPAPDVVSDLDDGSEAVIVAAPTALALGGVKGEVSVKDLRLPELAFTQSIGPLSKLFEQGDIVLKLGGEQYERLSGLGEADVPVPLVILQIQKLYRENLKYNPTGPKPTIYHTLKEVIDAGKYLDWRNDLPPTAEEMAIGTLLIEQPKGIESMSFPIEIEGKNYCLAAWQMVKQQYKYAAKRIFTAEALELKSAPGKLLSGRWELTPKLHTSKGNEFVIPSLALVGRATEGFISGVRALIG